MSSFSVAVRGWTVAVISLYLISDVSTQCVVNEMATQENFNINKVSFD